MSENIKGIFNISGRGGGYEEVCQTMLQKGYAWLDKRKDNSDLKGKTIKNVCGIFEPDSESAKELSEVITKDMDFTGAIHQAVMSHLFFIAKNGIDVWKSEAKQKEKEYNDKHNRAKKH